VDYASQLLALEMLLDIAQHFMTASKSVAGNASLYSAQGTDIFVRCFT
jgi:hypothetical protein